MAERNALMELAEEAEELKRVLEDLKFDRRVVVCDKLQRIVAELAKIEVYHNPYTGDDHWPTKDTAYKAVVACGKIAVGRQ